MPTTAKRRRPKDPALTIVVDPNEHQPQHHGYRFNDPALGLPPVNLVHKKLPVGDYTLGGYEERVIVERKSLEDLYGSFSQRKRDNMLGRIERMNAFDFAAMVVEAEFLDCLANPPRHSKLHPRSLSGTIIACQQRYPRVHWWFVGGAGAAEVLTYRILERFHRDRRDEREHAQEADGENDASQ